MSVNETYIKLDDGNAMLDRLFEVGEGVTGSETSTVALNDDLTLPVVVVVVVVLCLEEGRKGDVSKLFLLVHVILYWFWFV